MDDAAILHATAEGDVGSAEERARKGGGIDGQGAEAGASYSVRTDVLPLLRVGPRRCSVWVRYGYNLS